MVKTTDSEYIWISYLESILKYPDTNFGEKIIYKNSPQQQTIWHFCSILKYPGQKINKQNRWFAAEKRWENAEKTQQFLIWKINGLHESI